MEKTSSRPRRRFARFSYRRNQQVQNSWHGVRYENIDEDNAEERLQSHVCELSFQHMTSTDFVSAAKEKCEEEGGEDERE